jgi:hypothetical protein
MRLLAGLSRQFFSEVFSEWVPVNILYFSMEQMIVSYFSRTLGLSGADSVGGFVADAFESILFNKSLEQVYRMMIDLEPVIRIFFGVERQDFGDLCAIFIPMLVNNRWNRLKIVLSEGSFPGG